MKYEVFLVRYASIVVEADNEEESTIKADDLLARGYEVSTESDWSVEYAEKV